MTRSKRMSLPLLLVLLLLDAAQVGHANFFSREFKVKTDEGDEADDDLGSAPAGSTAAMGSEAQVGSVISFEDGVLFANLANNNKIPLVGVGVGNSPHEHVGAIVAEALQEDKKIRLIDTAHASHNEDFVAEGINAALARMGERDGKHEVHVITKVWYTHLGYERTKLSVEESLDSFKSVIDNEKVDIKLHVLLHWPRCFDNVPWMNCKQEEEKLSDKVKNAGPNPHLDPENAWKESWKLLEDMYLSDKYPIASIGVSNFHMHEIEVMDSFARIHPHILQVNIWSLLYDSPLVDYCHRHRIHVQVYNAMQGTIIKPEQAPRAFHHIQKVANDVSMEIGTQVTPAQVILAWLIQHGVSVIPRTARLSRLNENSATALVKIPAFTDGQVETIAHAVEAYLSGDDLEQDIHVSVTFHATNKDIMLYWRGQNGEEVRIAHVKQGETFHETTYPNHTFRTYDAANKDIYVDHQIQANFGEHTSIHVEL